MSLSLKEQVQNLSDGMKRWMVNSTYTQSDIDKCIAALEKYLVDIANSKSRKAGMLHVKEVVTALNSSAFGLIDTGRREQICNIIVEAAHEMGYCGENEAITDPWREW